MSWFKIEEKQPLPQARVLVWHKGLEYPIIDYIRISNTYGREANFFNNSKVTHWHELPNIEPNLAP